MSAEVLVVDGGREAVAAQGATDVAVGVLIDDQGRFLLTSRPA